MNGQVWYSPILDALQGGLPTSSITDFQSRDWFSSTFEGQQISVVITLTAGPANDLIARFVSKIPELEFPTTNGYFVADIAGNAVAPDQIRIEMLVIKE